MIKLPIYFIVFTLFSSAVYAKCFDIDSRQISKALNFKTNTDIVSLEAADCSSVKITDEGVSFVLTPDTAKIHGGVRSEVAIDYPFKLNEKITYQFSLKIPKDFKSDRPENRWWLIAQWHDQPDRTKGETWAEFPKLSPPIAIYLESREGVTGIGIVTFGKNKKSWFPYPLGKWLTLNINIEWSTNNNGMVDLKILEQPKFNHKIYGKNMNNTYQHYLKIGQYRHPDIKLNSAVYFKNLKIYKTPE